MMALPQRPVQQTMHNALTPEVDKSHPHTITEIMGLMEDTTMSWLCG